MIIEKRRRFYNEIRPHSSLGYSPTALGVLMPARPAAQPEPASPAAPSLALQPEVPRVKWSMIDVSFLADFLKLEGEIGHEEEAVFG